MRFLIAPKPGDAGGPSIFLKRMAAELVRRGYQWTAVPFKYLGFSLLPWQQAIIMNNPRFLDRILDRGKPVLAILGQPTTREFCEKYGIPYLPEYAEQELRMADVICLASKVVFISGYIQQMWADIFRQRELPFPSKDKAIIAFHGVDLHHFRPLMEPPELPFVLGSAGFLRLRFRLSTLFRVSRLLEFNHRLLIVGSMDSECQEEFASSMEDPALKKRTTYVPWVDSESLPQYYRQMHCLFHPVCGEAFGIVVAEALACGVPVVVPQYGGPAEFVLPDGGVAIGGERWDYGEEFCRRMAEGVTRVHDHWEEYSRGARKQAEQNVSFDKMTDTYLEHMGLPSVVAT